MKRFIRTSGDKFFNTYKSQNLQMQDFEMPNQNRNVVCFT